jgi:biotin operon repressor
VPITPAPSGRRVSLAKRLLNDERARILTRSQRSLVTLLASRIDPATGWTRKPVSDQELADLDSCSPTTIKRNRQRLRELGLITDYRPGSGWTATSYALAQSWERAEQVADRSWTEASDDTGDDEGERDVDRREEPAASLAEAIEDDVIEDEENTEITLTYEHPDRSPWENPVVYTRTVRIADLPKILQAVDDAEA